MGHTRAVRIQSEKLSERDLLAMVGRATDNGFPVPQATLLEASTFKTVAALVDSGQIELHKTAYGPMYTITDVGRKHLEGR
jgi:hypothetical protein